MLKKNLFYSSLLSISQFIFPLITFPYSSRILGPNGIGAVNFIDSITAYFILFSSLGIPGYGVRETAKKKDNPEELAKFISEIVFIHFISVTIFSLIYFITALVIPGLRVHLDLVFIGICLLYINVVSFEWFFQGLGKFKYTSIRSFVSKVLSVIFLFVFLHKESPSFVYYLIGASGTALNSLINIIEFRKHAKLKFSDLSLKQHIKPLFTILGSSLAISVYVLMDSIVLGLIKGDAAVGLYSTALRIARIPFAIVGAISAVMIPLVSHAYHNKDIQAVVSLASKSFSFICVAGMPIAFGMFVSANFLITSFAGKNFESAVLILQILSPVIMVVGINNIFAIQLLHPIGQEKILFKAVFVSMIFSIISNLVLISLFSFIGAAITNLLTEVLVTTLSYFFVKKFIPVKLDQKIFLQCLLSSALFIPIASTIRTMHLGFVITEILIIIICAIFYCCYVWFFIDNMYVNSIKRSLLNKLNGTSPLLVKALKPEVKSFD